MIRFAGQIFEPLPSGALLWRAEMTLLVADLHFEKMASFAWRGQLLPPYDTGLTLLQLEADLGRTRAERVVALGDSFHREDGAAGMLAADRTRLDRLARQADWVWLSGNHDPLPHGLAGMSRQDIEIAGITLAHIPERRPEPLIAGHLHPAARVAMNGRTMRAPCFVCDDRLMILPAYGSSTGSLNILSSAFQGLVRHDRMQVVMTGRDRVYPVSARRLVGG
ncbi:MAG: ligase-associated DNA damage response endonuclease PdeM [Alphaproteobacteria bacterium]|nr:ligase-associated DNA damage response endonuclease PdeM [Alphaproteobacteria bacterium]